MVYSVIGFKLAKVLLHYINCKEGREMSADIAQHTILGWHFTTLIIKTVRGHKNLIGVSNDCKVGRYSPFKDQMCEGRE